MTVAELEQRMGASELAEWKAFWSTEPWGPYRDNIHSGLIAATLANIYRKKNTQALTFEDFMLTDPEEYKRRKTLETYKWMKSVAKRKT